MRFGLTPLQFQPIVEQIFSGGAPDLSHFNILEILKRGAQIEHISVLELTMDINSIFQNVLTAEKIDDLNGLRDELGISYTVHLPLWSIELATFNEYVRRASVECMVDAIKMVEPLEPEVYVLHCTGPLATEFTQLKYPDHIVHMIGTLMSGLFSAKSVEEIITGSEVDPSKIGIENLEFPFDITRNLVDEYGTGICFDTGHLLSGQSGNETVLEFYRKHRDKIVELHLHDGRLSKPGERGYFDHKPLGIGDMPIREFLMKLVKDKFNGPLIFELGESGVIASLKKIKEVVPEALV
ncbi:MAG: cobamide remodeling phosphodiesterase CbiR [Candidatus Thorarchaeota archaeon]